MRGFKLAAIAVGVLIAFLLVGTVVGAIVHAVIELLIVAAIAGAIVVAIKIARSNRQVSGRSRDSEIRDQHSTRPLPRTDLDEYVPPAPAPAPRPASRPASADVDDELARLKREMGSLLRTACPDGPTAAGSRWPGGSRRPGFHRI